MTVPGVGGRPAFVVDEHTVATARQMASTGVWDKDIAYCIGVTPTFFIELKRRYPELERAVKEGRAEGHRQDALMLANHIRNGSIDALKFRLSRQHKWIEDGKVPDEDDTAERDRGADTDAVLDAVRATARGKQKSRKARADRQVP